MIHSYAFGFKMRDTTFVVTVTNEGFAVSGAYLMGLATWKDGLSSWRSVQLNPLQRQLFQFLVENAHLINSEADQMVPLIQRWNRQMVWVEREWLDPLRRYGWIGLHPLNSEQTLYLKCPKSIIVAPADPSVFDQVSSHYGVRREDLPGLADAVSDYLGEDVLC